MHEREIIKRKRVRLLETHFGPFHKIDSPK
jgi:hypothetical protein